MTKKLVSGILMLCLASSLFAQNKKIKLVLSHLAKIESYECTNKHAFDFPFNMEYEAKTTCAKNQKDADLGFYYSFFYIKTKESESKVGDFSIYNGGSAISSYKNQIRKTSRAEKPQAFQEKIFEGPMGKGIAPAIHKSPTLFTYLLFEVEKDLKANAENYIVKADSVIDGKNCFHFQLKKENVCTDIFFDVDSLLPRKHAVYSESPMGNQKRETWYSHYNSINKIPLSYFNEENILPENWETLQMKARKPKNFIHQMASNWQLPCLQNDSTYSLSQFTGKTIVLEFTATWCGHCWEAAIMMNNLHEKFEDDNNVVLLSVFSSEVDKKDMIEKFADRHNIKNTILYDAVEVGEQYEAIGYPSFFIIDKNGKIIEHFRGFSNKLEDKITKTLKEQEQ